MGYNSESKLFIIFCLILDIVGMDGMAAAGMIIITGRA